MKKIIASSVLALSLSTGVALADGHASLKFPVGEGAFSWDSYNAWAENAPDFSGETVTISGPWLQPEDGVFRSAIAYFAAATGAEVIYTGSDSFEQQIVIDAEAGAAPAGCPGNRSDDRAAEHLKEPKRGVPRHLRAAPQGGRAPDEGVASDG